MEQYIKPVEAVKLTDENMESVVTWMNGLSELRKDYKGRYILVAIMNDWHSAGVGQWVVKDSNGNYQVVNDADFHKLYTPSPARAEQDGPWKYEVHHIRHHDDADVHYQTILDYAMQLTGDDKQAKTIVDYVILEGARVFLETKSQVDAQAFIMAEIRRLGYEYSKKNNNHDYK